MVLSSLTSNSSHSLVERMKQTEAPLFSSFSFSKIGRDYPSLLSRINDGENIVLSSPIVEDREIPNSEPMDSNYSAASLLKRLGMDPEQVSQADSIFISKDTSNLISSANLLTSSDVAQAHTLTIFDRVQASDIMEPENMAEQYVEPESCMVPSVPITTGTLQKARTKIALADALTLHPITNQIQKNLSILESPISSLSVLNETSEATQEPHAHTASVIRSSAHDLCLADGNLDPPLPLLDEPFLDAQRVTELWGEVYKVRSEGRVDQSFTENALEASGQCRTVNPDTVEDRTSSAVAMQDDKAEVIVSPITSGKLDSAALNLICVVSATLNTDHANSDSTVPITLSDHLANVPNTCTTHVKVSSEAAINRDATSDRQTTSASKSQSILRPNRDVDNTVMERRRHLKNKQSAVDGSTSVHAPVGYSPPSVKDTKALPNDVLEPTHSQFDLDKSPTGQLVANAVDTRLSECHSLASQRKSIVNEEKSIFVPAGTPGGKFYASTTLLPMNRHVKSDVNTVSISGEPSDGETPSHESKVRPEITEVKNIKLEAEVEAKGVSSLVSSYNEENIVKRKRSPSPTIKLEFKDEDLRMQLSGISNSVDPPRKKRKGTEMHEVTTIVKSELLEAEATPKPSLFSTHSEESAARSLSRSSSHLDHMKVDTGICSAIDTRLIVLPTSVAQSSNYLSTHTMSANAGRDLITSSAESSFQDQRDQQELVLPTITCQEEESGDSVSAKSTFINTLTGMKFVTPFGSPPARRQRVEEHVPLRKKTSSPIRHKDSFPDHRPEVFVPENSQSLNYSPMLFDNRVDSARHDHLPDLPQRYEARKLSPISPRVESHNFKAQFTPRLPTPPRMLNQYYAESRNVDMRGSPKTSSNVERANVGHFAQVNETDARPILRSPGIQQISLEPQSNLSRLPSYSYLGGDATVSPRLQARQIVHLRRDRRQNNMPSDRHSLVNQSNTEDEMATVGHQSQQRWDRGTNTQAHQCSKTRSSPALIERFHDGQLVNHSYQVPHNYNSQRNYDRYVNASNSVQRGVDNVRNVSVNANQSLLAHNVSTTKIPLSKRINILSDAGRSHSNANRDSTRGRGATRFRGQRPFTSPDSQLKSERSRPNTRSLEDRIS